MSHNIYIISDIEMGRGDIMDDFSDDYQLIDFIKKIKPSTEKQKSTLVLLGDIFDFLKMSYKGLYPRYITEEISLWKMDEIISTHKDVFKALKDYLTNPNCDLHFIIGNHDADLVWPNVQNRIKETLRSHDQVKFNYHYKTNDIHAEHGHLVDPFFTINIKKPIIKYNDKQILNLPWGAYACFTHLVEIKKKFPREETLYPNPLALELNNNYKNLSKKTRWDLLFNSLLKNPIIHYNDPTYKAPYIKLLKHVLKFGTNVLDDQKFIDHRVKSVFKQNPSKQIYVLGHSHVLTDMKKNDKQVFLTDTWRDEYDLNNDEKKKSKSYVKISYKNDKLNSAELKLLED